MIELPITALFGALFGIAVIPMTVVIGLRRAKVGVLFFDGGDDVLRRRIRSHANFLEYVPLGLLLMALSEINGASAIFLYSTATALVLARILHYLTLNFFDGATLRQISMLGTTGAIFSFAIWLLLYYWRYA